MSRSCGEIAQRLGLPRAEAELIRLASKLHDIGKLAVPDEILLKPGALTPEERRAVERHAEVGHELLAGSGEPLVRLAATIARTHHERLDGSGYPRGLAGAEIPLEGRIVAVADVFDALTSERVYRPAHSRKEAIRLLVDGSGTLYDPAMVRALLDTLAGAA
jgi:putative two-component system response regulator